MNDGNLNFKIQICSKNKNGFLLFKIERKKRAGKKRKRKSEKGRGGGGGFRN